MNTMDSANAPRTPEQVEHEKDKLDLRPAMEYVEKNQNLFEKGVRDILTRQPSEPARAWGNHLQFPGIENIEGPQIGADDARELLTRMPESLLALSNLEKISYEFADEVVVPVFDQDGNLVKDDWVKYKDFGNNNEHRTRLLVGKTPYTAELVYMSALPKTVYESADAARLYQTHVLLHEFFHTAEFPIFRSGTDIKPEGERPEIALETDGAKFTLQDWWNKFEELMLSHQERPVSRYAATYEGALNQAAKRTQPKEFLTAVEEQICEAFVAYQLNLISNDEEWTDFKEARPQMWQLMDSLCRAKLIKKDDKMSA